MGIVYRKAKIKLNYRDEKPEVYKAMQLVYPPIKEKVHFCTIAFLHFCIFATFNILSRFAQNYKKIELKNYQNYFFHLLPFNCQLSKNGEKVKFFRKSLYCSEKLS